MRRKGRILEAPDDLLTQWVPQLPRGRALDLGAGSGEAALWLAERGFSVEAVERDAGAVARLRRLGQGTGLKVFEGDLRSYEFKAETYILVLTLAVLHFVPGWDRPGLAARLAAALKPGGLLIARAFVGDQAAGPSGSGEAAADADFHPLAAGELPRLFPTLTVEFHETYRWVDPRSPHGYRSGASLVARRPQGGGV